MKDLDAEPIWKLMKSSSVSSALKSFTKHSYVT